MYVLLEASAKVYKLKGEQELMITTKLTLKLSHLYVLHVVHEGGLRHYLRAHTKRYYNKDEVEYFEL